MLFNLKMKFRGIDIMDIDILKEIDKKGLLHSFDPYWSRPEDFIEFIKEYGKTNYRSTYWINFQNFKNYKYFIVFFVEAGTKGEIPAWGLCDTTKCKRVKEKQDYDSFLNIKYGFLGAKDFKFKSVFHYILIDFFKNPYNCTEFNLIKTRRPIKNLKLLRSALYVNIPHNIMNEIKTKIKKINYEIN